MLRVLTLNLWNLSGDWRRRREEVVRWISQLQPDVVCLQEVIDDGAGRNTARWLAERLAFEGCTFAGVEARPGYSFGNAILARHPLGYESSHLLPDSPGPSDIQRLLVHGRTADGNDVFCTHLTSLYPSGRLREQQVLRIVEIISEVADPASPLPPILAGDFNAEPDSTEIRYLTGSTSLEGRSTYFQDAWRVAGGREPGHTWHNDNPFAAAEYEPDRRIDYVFAGWRRPDGRGRIAACSVVCDRPLTGIHPSDHYGLLADIVT